MRSGIKPTIFPAGSPDVRRALRLGLMALTAMLIVYASLTLIPSSLAAAGATARTRTRVNLRAGPGTRFAILRVLGAEEQVAVLGKAPAGDWFQVRTMRAQEGWVLGTLLVFDTPLGEIPIVQPKPTPTPTPLLPPTPIRKARVTAIGDSIMLGSARHLQQAIGDIEIDAAVSRQAFAVIPILRARRDAKRMGECVIIHTGNNGAFTAKQLDDMMQLMAGVQRVVFVTVQVPRPWRDPNNTMLAAAVPRYPNAALADWYTATATRPELFWDGVHPWPEGMQIYAGVIAAQLQGYCGVGPPQ